MKFAIAMILAAFAVVPALAHSGTNVSARAKHRALIAAMSPEERTARMSAVRKSKAEARAGRTRSATAKFAAAKAACPDCYRVVVTNGVYVGMDYATYTNYVQQGSARPIRARGAKISPGRRARLMDHINASRHRRNVNGRRNRIRRRSSEMGY